MTKAIKSNKISLNLREEATQTSKVLNMDIDLEFAFNELYQRKENENLKERTLKDHKNHFKYFSTFLYKHHPEVKKVEDISMTEITDYIKFMRKEKGLWDDHKDLCKVTNRKGLAPSTVNIRLRTLRTWLNYWFKNGYIQKNLSAEIKLLKTDKHFRGIDAQHIKRILAQLEKTSKYTDLRDYVVILLLCDIGARINNLLSLKISDINLTARELSLTSSTSKTREDKTYPISDFTAEWIQHLIKKNEEIETESDFLFLSMRGNVYKANSFRKRLNKFAEKAGIPNDVRVTPHSFRHFVATTAHEKGASLFDLQLILGHKSIEATERYLWQDKERARTVHKQFSPLETVI
ncbi:tyrosine-type recombinase/integrase [Halobacillus litoralis]|uniref:Tyrosine-type recombinase/integrase n=1 Tax=Halobacillus litoralis TaxID=45668 RepID=A0A845F4V5_9BACI|nr:tyrosine-type recombinase/integrase [Halobacillus litoralis]MYL69232.1 tyrosine-type recombinase/integrase [Halobacillus litoralis]